MKTLLAIIFTFYIAFANAQNEVSNPLLKEQGPVYLSSLEVLEKAKSTKQKDLQSSILLANEALKRSETNEASAQAHSFLGELALESKDIVDSVDHFLQASLIYKKMNDDRYQQADKAVDALFPLAEQYDVTWPIAVILTSYANTDYKQKRYADSIVQYRHVLTYLPDEDKKTKRQRGQTYKKIAQAYKRLKKAEETAVFYHKALVEYTEIQDINLMARTLNTLAEAERKLGHYVVALDYSTQGLELHNKIDDPEGRAKALAGAGIIYRNIGLYEKSLTVIYQSHLYYKEVNDFNGIAETSNQMGLIYTRLKEFEQARSFYQLTIDLPPKKIKAKRLAAALRESAVIDINFGDYASAKKMATKAYKIYQSEKNRKHESVTTRIIGNAYRQEKNISQAIAYYRKSLAIATEIGSEIYQVKALTPLASMLSTRNVEESIQLLKRAEILVERINSTASKLYIYREFRKAEKIRGNFEASLDYAEKEIYFKDLVQKEKDDNDLTIIKAKLYSHKKEMELVSLKEKSKVDQLELIKKNIEIAMAEQETKISELELTKSELELTKNKYANMTLALLLLGSILSLFFIYRQFIASKLRNEELDALAARDPLTNCYNRRVLFENIEPYFDNPVSEENVCIIMVDVDHFKAVNDKYGHNIGDSVLCGVANLFQACVRESDIVARFGGEEFCIVLHQVLQNDALHIAETIRYKVENSRFDGVSVTCSFGVTSTQFEANSVAALINQADLALYESKSQGRNLVTIWNSNLDIND